jgi:hypothetical protein
MFKIFVTVLFDSGIEKEFELEQTKSLTKEQLEKAASKMQEGFEDVYDDDKQGSYKFTTSNKELVVLNVQKTSLIKFQVRDEN